MLDENMKLTDCYYEKKDWRACKKEVSWGMGSARVFFPDSGTEKLPTDKLTLLHTLTFKSTNSKTRRWRYLENAGNAMAMTKGQIRRRLIYPVIDPSAGLGCCKTLRKYTCKLHSTIFADNMSSHYCKTNLGRRAVAKV